jgi:hypothetical protein
MTLLTIAQDACDRLSLPRPAAVISSNDQTAAVMRGLAQQEGKELARRVAWKALTAEHTFTTVATEAQDSTAFPTSSSVRIDEWILPQTCFNRTSRRRMSGPLSAEQWQHYKSSLVTYVNPAFRIRGTSFLITPTPSAGNTVAYEYVTKRWCQSNAGAAQAAWTADNDTALLDEELHTLGIVWRFRKSKGLEYAEDFRAYEVAVEQAMMREGTRPRLSTDGMQHERIPTAPQIPETLVF